MTACFPNINRFVDIADQAMLAVDELTYSSYSHNRRISPDTTPDAWRKVYGLATDRMETRFQMEARGAA